MTTTRPVRVFLSLAAFAAVALMSGCLERVLHITSDPPGALVHLNDQEVGRTPLDVHFHDFGTYDVRLQLAGFEPLHEGVKAGAPPWEWPGIDLVAMALPIPFKTEIAWHFELQPVDNDPSALLERAKAVRDAVRAEAATMTDEDEGGEVTEPEVDDESAGQAETTDDDSQ